MTTPTKEEEEESVSLGETEWREVDEEKEREKDMARQELWVLLDRRQNELKDEIPWKYLSRDRHLAVTGPRRSGRTVFCMRFAAKYWLEHRRVVVVANTRRDVHAMIEGIWFWAKRSPAWNRNEIPASAYGVQCFSFRELTEKLAPLYKYASEDRDAISLAMVSEQLRGAVVLIDNADRLGAAQRDAVSRLLRCKLGIKVIEMRLSNDEPSPPPLPSYTLSLLP